MGLCPFRWFVSCVPGIEAPFKDPLPAAEGSLTHDLIGAILGEIASGDGRIEAIKLDEYLSILDRFFTPRLEAVLRRNGPSLRIALELVKPRLRARMAALLAAEIQFEEQGWSIGEFEVPLSASYPAYGIRLEGRADRIALMEAPGIEAGEAPVALIDYKKNRTPAKKDFLVDEEGKLADCQLAAYASILDSQGRNMGAALYWSIETCKPLPVFGPGGERPDWESFAPERRALDAALAEASSILAEGRFLDLKPTAAACGDCGFKPICRAHYSSERL
jgi:RecB family exonuclease